MPSFALVTEGITDQVALDAILAGHYKSDDLEVLPVQPLRDATDQSRQDGFAGWYLVLEYCSKFDLIIESLQFNDYLIVQIDTDVAEEVGFGVALTAGGADKDTQLLVDEVIDVLRGKLGFWSVYSERVFFAVCVHSLECWLVPLYSVIGKNKKNRTKSCENSLRMILGKKGIKFQKDHDCYSELVRAYDKRARVEATRALDVSFDLFVKSLPNV